MVFDAFNNIIYIAVTNAAIYTCLKFFLPVLPTIFLLSHWQLSHITIIETMGSSEKGMNPLTLTIINPWKEYWPSWGLNHPPPVLMSCILPTKLQGPATKFKVPVCPNQKPMQNTN